MCFARPLSPWLQSLGLSVALVLGTSAHSADTEITVQIKDHRFEPAQVRVPAQTRVKLIVHNADATPEEFESHALNREKLIPAGAKATLLIGPLQPGRYPFEGEFHPKTAQGVVIVE